MTKDWLTGHATIGSVTIFGRNAMHWGVDIRLRHGYLCFRLPFRCFGKWWPLYLYYSSNGTPSHAVWGFGQKGYPWQVGGQG